MSEGLSHAASAVLSAVSRVAQRVRDGFPLHPAYILTPADLYDHEPMVPATPAELLALSRPPNGLCFAHLEGDGHFLVHYGTLAFSMYGRCLVASRDAPDTPTPVSIVYRYPCRVETQRASRPALRTETFNKT